MESLKIKEKTTRSLASIYVTHINVNLSLKNSPNKIMSVEMPWHNFLGKLDIFYPLVENEPSLPYLFKKFKICLKNILEFHMNITFQGKFNNMLKYQK